MEARKGGNGRNAIQTNYLHGGAVTSMLSPIHKQGYVGNLTHQSKYYLQDLLNRQEKMLSNRAFIQRLPDKGEKIQKFAMTLKDLLKDKEQEGSCNQNNTVADSIAANSPSIDSVNEDLKIMEKGFSDLSVHEGQFYDVVVNAEKRKNRSKFALNRAHKSEMKVGTGTAGESIEPTTQKHKHEDLTSASISNPVHGSTKVISIAESRTIYTKERKKLQELKTQRIAERLTKQMKAEYVMDLPVSSNGEEEYTTQQPENDEDTTESSFEDLKEGSIDLEAVD